MQVNLIGFRHRICMLAGPIDVVGGIDLGGRNESGYRTGGWLVVI